MKKLLLSAMLIASVMGVLSAQETTSVKPASFGVKVGLNFASFNGDDSENLKSNAGYVYGVFLEIPVSEKLSIQPELLFSDQGALFSDAGYNDDFKFNFRYVNIPIMLKYQEGKIVTLQFGPQIGFLTKSEIEYDGITVDLEERTGVVPSAVDFGLNFGLGFQLSQKLSIDARYNLGLTNIWDEENFDNDEEEINKNSVIQLSLGYKF